MSMYCLSHGYVTVDKNCLMLRSILDSMAQWLEYRLRKPQIAGSSPTTADTGTCACIAISQERQLLRLG